MSEELEALGRLYLYYDLEMENYKYLAGHSFIEDLDTIEKALKALEIIKECFWLEDFQDFVAFNGRLPKSLKEKYDLLKEVLYDEKEN